MEGLQIGAGLIRIFDPNGNPKLSLLDCSPESNRSNLKWGTISQQVISAEQIALCLGRSRIVCS